MDLIINKYGTRIRSTGERIKLTFPQEEKEKEYAARRVQKITILCPSSISTGAIQCALKHGIDIVYLGNFGKPIGRIISTKPEGQSALRRAQARFVASEQKCLLIAKELVGAKTQSQINYLKILTKKHKKDFSEYIKKAESIQKNIKNTKNKNLLFGIEGRIAVQYFTSLKKIINHNGRNPKKHDLFNNVLNYGYGLLYNEIESACLHTGLDPYLGVYHTDRSNKPSLVCDLIEEFRVPIIDSVVFPLLISKKLSEENHITSDQMLSKVGRKKIVRAVKARLQKEILLNRKTITLEQLIQHQSQMLAHLFLNKKQSYQASRCRFKEEI